MLKFLRLYVEGFCSIDKLDINLDQGQIILIKAPNGNGKSTMLSAIFWVLFGKTLKGSSDVNTWKDVRSKDYKGTKVTISFQRKESIYQIIRCYKYEGILDDGSKGKDRLLIIKDAEYLDIKGKINQQQKIVDILGLSQPLFTNSIMFGQGINRIIQESNADKKKLFEEIFDLNYLNIAKGIALEDKNHILSQVNDLERESSSLKKELDTAITTYKDLKERERDFSNHIREERKELREDRKKLKAKRADILPKLGVSLTPKIKSLQKDLDKLHQSYNKAKSISNIPIEEFIKNVYNMISLKKYKDASKALLEVIEAFHMMEELRIDIDNKSKEINRYKDKHQEYNKYNQILADIDDDLDTIDNQLMKLKGEKLKVLSPKYKSQIKTIRAKLRKVDEDYHNKDLELENYNWVIDDPLGNNGIKAYLFDSSLDFLNRELARYSDILGFHISFEIDLSSTRKEFVTLIERDGLIIDYDELSGGEKQLVDISMALAMNQALTLSKGINIAFLDEVFESLSSDNIDLVIQLVREVFKDKTLYLISHHDSLPFPNVKILEVEKRNGLSYYKGL